MKKVNLGLIGSGHIGKYHLRNCSGLDSANLVAVADISKKALKLAERMGIKQRFTNYNQLLKESNIDAVIVSLPTHLHATCAINAAEEGKHVFLEKPLARNIEEGQEIISATRKNNVKLMVGYHLRFHSIFRDLKRKLRSGVLGEVQIAQGTFIGCGPFFHRTEITRPRPVPEWWFKKELTGGGALLDLGSHMINLMRWYFGEVNNIKAHLGYRFNLDFEDHAICIVDFASGTTSIINVGWFSLKDALAVELFGTVSHASAYHSYDNQRHLRITPKMNERPHLTEISYFVHCIKEDLQPSPSGENALKDLEIITRVYNGQSG